MKKRKKISKARTRRHAAASPIAQTPSAVSIMPSGLAGAMVPNADQPVQLQPNELFSARALVDPSRLIAGRLFYPYNPSILATRKGLQIFDQMKIDEQVKVCLSFMKNTMLAGGWEVVSPDDQVDDWEVTDFVHDNFNHIPGGMEDALLKVLLGVDYGYSVTEKVYGDVDWAPGKKALTQFISIKPHYIDIQADRHGNVLGLIQRYAPGQGWGVPGLPNQLQTGSTGAPGMLGIPALPPDKFVLYTHEIEFENHYGRSALESAYRAWWTKDNAYKWLAILLERYGMPPLFLFYDPNAYQGGQLTELQKILQSIKNSTMGLVPRSKKEALEFASLELASQGKDVFLGAMGRFDGDIAKALLMPSLIGATGDEQLQAGGRGGGSYARANVHYKMFLNGVRATQRRVATRAINDQIVRQLCDLNFAGLKSYPEFKFLDPDDETNTAIFELWQKLVEGQVVNRIPDDEDHIRKALKFPATDNPVVEPLLPKSGGFPEQEGASGGAGKGESGADEVPVANQSDDMKAFAKENDGVWMMVAGHPLCLRREALKAAA